MKKKILVIIPIGLLISFIALILIPTPYYIVRPGKVESLHEMVTIEDTGEVMNNDGDEGRFYMVTVIQQKATVIALIYGWLNPYIDIIHGQRVMPKNIDMEEYRRILNRWMEESKYLAQLIALKRSGYEVQIEGEGIKIHSLTENSIAEGLLKSGDIICQVDGEDVYLTDQVISIVQNREIGEIVSFTIKRDSERLNVDVKTAPLNNSQNKPGVGVYISALDWELNLPIGIDISTGKTSGPSAGMMFVLEILNRLSPGDLSGGRKIAGTGTINYFEKVGSIGGIKQKVKAAEMAGMDYFILPVDNAEEIKDYDFNIKLVPVSELKDVIDFLWSINVATSYENMVA